MLSKQLAISASSTYRGCQLITLYMCRIASWHERPGLHPKLFGSNFASHSGSRAILASACVPRSCMMGMPSGRFSGLPGLGSQIRRTGFTGAWRSMVEMRFSLCGGVRLLAPSTPAVFFPLFSCVTLRTARLFALQDEASSFWSLWAFFVSPRVVAWEIRRWSLNTFTSSFRQGMAFHSSL